MVKKDIYEVPSWDDYFMSMVYHIARKSKDKRTHIGAVIVGKDKEIKYFLIYSLSHNNQTTIFSK